MSTSSKSSAQSRTCHVGHSVQLAVAICFFCAGKHVHPKFYHRSNSHLKRTSTWSPSVLNSRWQFWSKLKTYLFRQACDTAWFLWEQFVEECNFVIVTVTVKNTIVPAHSSKPLDTRQFSGLMVNKAVVQITVYTIHRCLIGWRTNLSTSCLKNEDTLSHGVRMLMVWYISQFCWTVYFFNSVKLMLMLNYVLKCW